MTTLFAGSSVAHAASWVRATSPTASDLSAVSCWGSKSCVAVGKGGVVVYTTDGKIWTAGSSGTAITLSDVFAYSGSKIFAVGTGGTILKSIDGGVTWAAVTSGTTEGLTGVYFASSYIGWASGDAGTILKTTDGGTTWAAVTTTAAPLHDIDASSTSNVWAAGNDGTVFRSTDGGTTWSTVSYPMTPNDLVSVHVVSSSTAYIAGENGMFAKTTDSGVTWTFLSLTGFGSPEHATDMAWYSSIGGTVVGSAGSIVSTTDGGTTFTTDSKVFSPTDISSIAIPAVNYRYLVGKLGTIGTYDSYSPGVPSTVALTSGISYTNDTTPSLTWGAATDNESSVASYQVSVDSGTWNSVGNVLTASLTTALTSGSHTVAVRGVDAAGNVGSSLSTTFTVDLASPTGNVISPTSATAGSVMTFSAYASDASSGISSCSFLVNGVSVGTMTYSSTLVKYAIDYTFASAGSYSVQMSCTDVAGNTSSSGAVTVTVAASSTSTTTSSDTTAPTVGQISQTTATQNSATTLSATVSDNVAVTSCSLYVNSSYVGPLTISGSTASYSYTFGSTGSYSAYITCLDSVANVGIGASQTITVSATSTVEASKHDLIKLACTNSEVNDPCTAVYYYGDDGYRHAFPNSNVYYTWYTSFDSVKIVSSSFMSSLTIGHNVTYHPGTKMVKFTTVNTVYAVGTAGELRAIQSEELAQSLYGSTWNQQIDDISDAFHGNYAFGEIIDTTSDFSPSTVKAGSTSIEDVI